VRKDTSRKLFLRVLTCVALDFGCSGVARDAEGRCQDSAVKMESCEEHILGVSTRDAPRDGESHPRVAVVDGRGWSR
jgi:hypothetical protein